MEKSEVTSQIDSAKWKLPQKAKSARGTSPLWNRALERYREELDGEDDDEILAGAGSLEELVAYAKTIEPRGPESSQTRSRLGPTLKFVDDFSAIVAICLGANAKVIAFVWGSLRLIITLASSAEDAFQRVLDMLEELSLSLPRFRYYEENLPLDRSFENALIDLYTEIICFYARLIRYHKANPHLAMQDAGWQSFQKDFSSTVRRVKHLSKAVESEADLVKMRLEKEKYDEVLVVLRGMNERKAQSHAPKQCHYIPKSMSGRFKSREADLNLLRKGLDPDAISNELKSFALCGMGGVGKTQLALRYALDSKKNFDIILWIAADTNMSLDQSFRDAAIALGLGQGGSDRADELSATARVKNWLSGPNNGCSWLVIFDNADDVGLLHHVWPANGTGSVLITSRDLNATSKVASHGLNLQPFDEDTGADVLLQLLKIDSPDQEQRAEARKITLVLGGLPLALNQIAGFITQRKLRIQNFLSLYERNAAKVDARRQDFSDYPHTLATVFNMALENLDGPALCLLNLLSFLDPDVVPESIFEDGHELVHDPDFDFLADEMDLGDAEEILLQAALINKDSGEKTLSVHRLVQKAVLRQLNDAAKRKYFGVASDLLSLGFPDTWSKDVGHQKQEWARCERYLPHVNVLVGLASKDPHMVEKPDVWAEILLRCSWYLYEKEEYKYAKTFTRVALDSFTNKRNLAYASAVDLLGLIDLDMTMYDEALVSFEKGLSVRQALLPSSDPFIAFAFNNLALVYTEIPDLTKAEEYHHQAIQLRLQNSSDRIGNSYSNYAVTLLRKGEPDEAERTLMQCPSLQGCTDNTFLQADNPRFVGDMVLLSRIRQAQGRKNDALRLASKALSWRQEVHGDRFKTCDSMYDVACMLHEQGRTATALELLDGLCRIAETLELGEGQAARAEWRISRILEGLQREQESIVHAEKAIMLRKKFRPEEQDNMVVEESWERLAPFMLW